MVVVSAGFRLHVTEAHSPPPRMPGLRGTLAYQSVDHADPVHRSTTNVMVSVTHTLNVSVLKPVAEARTRVPVIPMSCLTDPVTCSKVV